MIIPEANMSLKNLMNRYFYGPSDRPDYTNADIPETRGQLFRVVLKVRLTSLIGPNLLFVVGCLPAAVWLYLNVMVTLALMQPERVEEIPAVLLTCFLILCPLVTLTGPFSMGLAYVMRNWARDEHAFAFIDFKDAFKKNLKQGLLYGLISGILPLIIYVCGTFYADMSRSMALFYIPIALLILIGLFWSLMQCLLPTMIVTYEQRFIEHLKNAALIVLMQLPKLLLLRLLTLVLPALILALMSLFPDGQALLFAIASIAYLLFIPALHALEKASFANAYCERYLNTQIEGARVNIGLRNECDSNAKQ